MLKLRKSDEELRFWVAVWFHQSREIEPKKQNPSTMERSFTERRFASFLRVMVKDPAKLSRVHMNALRAPLTVLLDLEGEVCKSFA
jgi:hypothetical protein